MITPTPPCSDGARARGDALAGTGSPGNRWFLLEIDGAWGHSAFLNSDKVLDPALGLRIVRRIEAAKMRTLAIRRPGRRRGEGRWRWAIVDARAESESIHWGEVERPEDVLTLELDGSSGTPSTRPIVALCTHGRHDRCCAVRGRKAIPSLVEQNEDITWECSHLGGDRFAGTMIVFPEGLYYGNVDDANVAEIVERHKAGLVEPRFLRGRSSLQPSVQVAQHHARELFDDNRIHTFEPLTTDREDALWTVRLDHEEGPIEVILREGLSAPILTTCSARHAGSVRTYELVRIGRM